MPNYEIRCFITYALLLLLPTVLLINTSFDYFDAFPVYRKVIFPKREMTLAKHNDTSNMGKNQADNCRKPLSARNYTICHRLPFREIKCGLSENRREYDSNKTRLVVPNIVHLVWFGQPKFRYYQYLALRSMASVQQPEKIILHYNKALPSGEYWEMVMSEIPCLEFNKIRAPTKIMGKALGPHVVAQTDAARIMILLQQGGIYIDSDVITVKNLDALRKYPVTLGRSVSNVASIGILLAEPKAEFLQLFYEQYPRYYSSNKFTAFTTTFMMKFYRDNQDKAHLEETSIQRPNPFRQQDGGPGATTLAHFDLSDNYFLHIHTGQSLRAQRNGQRFTSWQADKLRKMDNVYGEAARIALFGSPDLVFMPGEDAHDRVPTQKVNQLPPINTLQLKHF